MFDPYAHEWAVLALAAAVAALSIARTARLLTHDTFPPVQWFRDRIQLWLAKGKRRQRWLPLTECPFCLAPYLSAGMFVWIWLCDLGVEWWVVNGWWAMSYVAAMIVARDEPAEE
jgi:hypothetical protein